MSNILPPDYPVAGQLNETLGPFTSWLVGIGSDYGDKVSEGDRLVLSQAIKLGNAAQEQLSERSEFLLDFRAWDNKVAIANSARVVTEIALGITEDTLLIKANQNPEIIREGVQGSIGTFWQFAGQAIERSVGLFGGRKEFAVGEIYMWSDENAMVALVYTFGRNTDTVGTASRGILIGTLSKPDVSKTELTHALKQKANSEAIRASIDDGRQYRPYDHI